VSLAHHIVAAIADDPSAVAALRSILSEADTSSTRASEAPPPAYTVASLAKSLCVSEKTVRGWIMRGELIATKRSGRYLISRDAVTAFAAPRVSNRRRYRPDRRVPARTGPLRTALAELDVSR
jgi:excisionase family DNA binding protein